MNVNPSPSRKASPEMVAKLPSRQRIVALGEALLTVPSEERDPLALMLIEEASHQASPRPQGVEPSDESGAGPIELIARLPHKWRARHADDAMLALARAWVGLSPSMRQLGAGLGRDRWLRAARELAQDAQPAARLAAVAIAHDTADPGLGKVVGALLGDEHQSVRKNADTAMLRMTMTTMLEHLPPSLLGEEFAALARAPRVALPADPGVLALERCILLRAIADAAWSFAAHRCRSPLIAALLVMDRAVATPLEREIGARMHRLLSERNHPSHAPLRTVLKRTACPILRERALRWLVIGPMANAAIDRLSGADSMQEHEIVLRKAHLAMRPRRATKLTGLTYQRHTRNGREQLGSGALPEREQWDSLSENARVGLLSMASLISVDDQTRRAMLEPALAEQSARIRLRGCALCSPLDLTDYLYDASPAIARHAARRWSSAGNTPPRMGSPAWSHREQTARVNTRSGDPVIRMIARDESMRISPMHPASPASRANARRMLKNDPTGFVRLVRDELAQPQRRLGAVMLIRMLGLEQRFELDLIALAQNTELDPRARATAVMALGAVPTSSAGYVLKEALRDADDRVRANAVETIPEPGSTLVELKDDAHHRVRANAIRRVITGSQPRDASRARNAGESLLEMLGDDRPMHRLAASWAAQRTLVPGRRQQLGTTWNALINQVETLSATDEEPRVRQRAASCVTRVGAELQFLRDRVSESYMTQLSEDIR